MTIQESHVSTSNVSQISTSIEPNISTSIEPSVNIEPNISTSIEPSVNIEPQTTSAAGGTAEDAQEEYKALVEQLMAQNKALIEQNKSLQNQFGILIRSGASVERHGDSGSVSGPGNPDPLDPVQGMGQPEPKEPYVSLAELGSQIGKRDYSSHNSPQKE